MNKRLAIPAGLILALALLATSLGASPASAQDREERESRETVDERGPIEGEPPSKRPTPVPTPYVGPAVEAPILFALGDSYASGEGVTPFALPFNDVRFDVMEAAGFPRLTNGMTLSDGTTSTVASECHRSNHAAARVLLDNLRFFPPGWPPPFALSAHHLNFVACSGAVVADLTNPQMDNEDPNNPVLVQQPQLDIFAHAAEPDTTAHRIITVSIGGNDMRFADIIEACRHSNDCRTDAVFMDEIMDELALHEGRLLGAYRAIADANGSAADAVIFVAGGPHLFEEAANCIDSRFNLGERQFINGLATAVDTRSSDVVDQLSIGFADPGSPDYRPNVQIRYVPMITHFAGHGVCNSLWTNSNAWIRGLNIVNPTYSMHPNQAGQAERAGLIEAAILAWAPGNLGF